MEKEIEPETIGDNDTQQNVEKLIAQITVLKIENLKSNEEFGIQRGKMKELFLQKEEELKKLEEEIKRLRDERNEARSQFTIATLEFETRLEEEKAKYQSESSDLHGLFNATLEETSRYEKQVKCLNARIQELEFELKKQQGASSTIGSSSNTAHTRDSDSVLSAPGAMFSTFARKVASQLAAVDPPTHQGSAENLEDSMRKAKEDADVLKSLVMPLEEEIVVLKGKLRETDEQLQLYKLRETRAKRVNLKSKSSEDILSSNSGSVAGSIDEGSLETETIKEKPLDCEMCLNYERELVETQKRVTELERELSVLDRLKEELKRESLFRKKMEDKWQESKEQHKQEVTELQQNLETSEKAILELKQLYKQTKDILTKDFWKLSEEQKTVHDNTEKIQLENENLVGKYNRRSQELQNEEINLPNNVEELHEMWLGQREELIKARVGLEHSEESVRSLECLYSGSEEKQVELMNRLAHLESEKTKLEQDVIRRQTKGHQLEQICSSLKRELEQQQTIVTQLQAEKKKLEESEAELKLRASSLQTGLDNGEAVQKDFVLLSQSLQTELERLRSQNNVLRWEHEEDVTECRGCQLQFRLNKGKMNCRHCGRIFCVNCLRHQVHTGPHQRASRVCQVCHTLLDSKTAPYFSTGPPPQPI